MWQSDLPYVDVQPSAVLMIYAAGLVADELAQMETPSPLPPVPVVPEDREQVPPPHATSLNWRAEPATLSDADLDGAIRAGQIAVEALLGDLARGTAAAPHAERISELRGEWASVHGRRARREAAEADVASNDVVALNARRCAAQCRLAGKLRRLSTASKESQARVAAGQAKLLLACTSAYREARRATD
jgi:hypothetical protein